MQTCVAKGSFSYSSAFFHSHVLHVEEAKQIFAYFFAACMFEAQSMVHKYRFMSSIHTHSHPSGGFFTFCHKNFSSCCVFSTKNIK